MNLANTIRSMYESKQDFEPHMMYDPETGKAYKAEKPEDHERMKKLGYTHEKPETKDEKDLDEAFEKAFDDFLAEEESLDEALIGDLKKVEDAMMGTKNKEQGIQAVMDVMKVNKKKATHLVNRILKMKGSQKGKVTFKEANMSDVKKQLSKVKGLSKDAYNQLITLPMPVLTTMVNQLSGLVASYDMKEEVELNENQVMSAQFKVGDIPNSDLFTSIEKLKVAKKKAEKQRTKLSDPVLVKSLEDVIKEIDKTIKGAEKVEDAASKAIAKVAPSIKNTFQLISRKKYLMNSTEVEGDQQLDEAYPKAPKGMRWKTTNSVTAAQAIKKYGKKNVHVDKGGLRSGEDHIQVLVREELDEAFNIDKGATVKMDFGAGQALYGKVIKQIKVNGKPAATVQWKSGTKGNFRMDQFAVAKMDRKADYVIKDDGVRFDQKESVELEEDYFMVQYYDKKGKADTTKFSKFDNEQKAKKYLDRANKAEKEGEYKMFKVKGKMESTEMNESDEKYISLLSVQLDEANKGLTPYLKKAEKFMMPSKNKDQGIQFVMKGMKVDKEKATEIVDTILKIKGGQRGRVTFRESNENFFGTAKNHGISDSLLDAVRGVVTGQEPTNEDKPEPVQEPEQINEDNTNDKSDDGEGLDKVQPKAVKKKFKDRKDKDIDNDGDVDSSDKFLHKKRKAISKAIDKDDSDEKTDKEGDEKEVKSGKKEKVETKPKLDENFFKKKYGNRWERVMEATATKLAMKKD